KLLDERNAELATSAEIEAGSSLFFGQTQFQYDARPCVSCHTVRGAGLRGGTLGPDLTSVYARYQDKALTLFLRHPCFQWSPSATTYLTGKESYAVKAFLRQITVLHSAVLK